MPKFAIKTMVTFYAEVECKDEADAEAKGWEWEDEDFMYDSVYSIEVEELEDYDSED